MKSIFIQSPPNGGVCKFGRNPDVDSGQVHDIWDYGGDGLGETYTWPTDAATTTVVSSDDTDDNVDGDGALTVTVDGLDENFHFVRQTVTMAGDTPVELDTDLIRVFRAKVATAGADGTNAGTTDVKHGATILARISIGFGQTLMALYTVPADHDLYLAEWHASALFTAAGSISCRLDVRPFGGAWNCKETHDMGGYSGGGFERHFSVWQNKVSAKSDIRIRVYGGSDNAVEVSAGFDLLWLNPAPPNCPVPQAFGG